MSQFMESMRGTAHRIKILIQELVGSALDDVKQRVRQYFRELRTLLDKQANAALNCVDKKVKKDWKLLNGAQKVENSLVKLEEQQQHHAQLGPDSFMSQSSIPIIFSRDNRVHIRTKINMRVLMLGLDCSGKTIIAAAMRGITLLTPPPATLGFNVGNIEYENLVVTLWDVGGGYRFRPLWRHYYHDTQAVIFVIDSNERARFGEAQKVLSEVVSEEELKDSLFLIYANKQDIPGCATIEELTNILSLQKLFCGRTWYIQATSPLTDASTSTQGFQWLKQQLGVHKALYNSSS